MVWKPPTGSGPSGGAVLARATAERCEARRVVSFDMGGTTAKICLIEDQTPKSSRTFEIDRSERFLNFATSDFLRPLLPKGMRPVRSILFDKTPDENWPVAWHQDLTITVDEKKEVEGYGPWSVKDDAPHVQPPASLLENMVTLRIHLDPTPEENGALRVIPGSHLGGKDQNPSISDEQAESAITCACEAGDVLMMSPLILHASSRSTQPTRRRILHFEYAREKDLDPALAWHEPN